MNKLFIAIVLVISISCNSEVDYSPREINFNRDICCVCKMGLVDQRYTAQLINNWGEVIWFDDIGCLAELMEDDEWNQISKDSIKIFIGHCETGKWLDAEKTFFRYGDTTPMGFGYGALNRANDSTYTYKETIKRIHEGKSLVDEFLKKMEDKRKEQENQN